MRGNGYTNKKQNAQGTGNTLPPARLSSPGYNTYYLSLLMLNAILPINLVSVCICSQQ